MRALLNPKINSFQSYLTFEQRFCAKYKLKLYLTGKVIMFIFIPDILFNNAV